jgi:HlyD family secretion protein
MSGNHLSKAAIHSPINGIVLSRSVEPGQTVAASPQAPVLFKLAENLARMELHAAVDEADGRSEEDATFTVMRIRTAIFGKIIQVDTAPRLWKAGDV